MISEKNDDFKNVFSNHEIIYILTKGDIPRLNGGVTVPLGVKRIGLYQYRYRYKLSLINIDIDQGF